MEGMAKVDDFGLSATNFTGSVIVIFDISTQKCRYIPFLKSAKQKRPSIMCFISDCYSFQCSLHLFKMPVMWRETDSDKRFLLRNVYSTKHDSLDE